VSRTDDAHTRFQIHLPLERE